MIVMHLLLSAAVITAPMVVAAQADAIAERVMARVRAAMAPALPFPASDDSGAVPADGRSLAPWMVRPHHAGERTIQILANPYNEEHQRRATRAMAQIQASIEAAQRRADVQFERAVADAKRTGQSQDVDGVTLADEGLAGARIDAESHVTVDVQFNQPAYRFAIASSIEPRASVSAIPRSTAVLSVPAHVYRDSTSGEERFCESQTIIYLGRVATPSVERRGSVYEMTAESEIGDAISSIVIRLRGNEALLTDLLRQSNWASVLELIE